MHPVCTHTHACPHSRAHTHTHTNMTFIGVHEMHGRVHPNECHVTDLLVVDLHSSLAYFMMTYPLPIAGKLPIKTLVARQLPTHTHTHTHTLSHTNTHINSDVHRCALDYTMVVKLVQSDCFISGE